MTLNELVTRSTRFYAAELGALKCLVSMHPVLSICVRGASRHSRCSWRALEWPSQVGTDSPRLNTSASATESVRVIKNNSYTF